MYKRILMILLLCFLTGCNTEEDVEVLKNELHKMEESVQVNISDINEELNQMKDTLEIKDNALEKQKKEIAKLTLSISKLEESIINYEIKLTSLENQAYYNDYLTEFIHDIVKEIDEYSTISGRILRYNVEENILELDVLEYVAYYDDQRIEALNIDRENEPIIAGAYIYDALDDNRLFKLSDDIKIKFHMNDEPGIMINGSLDDLQSRIQQKPKQSYTLHLINNVVIRITEDFHD